MEDWSLQALSPTYVELTFQLKRGTEILSYLYKQTNKPTYSNCEKQPQFCKQVNQYFCHKQLFKCNYILVTTY